MTNKEAKRLLEKLKRGDIPPLPHYCGKCGVIRGDIVKHEITETYNIKGDTSISVSGYAAYCPICGARISDECDNELDIKAYREYRNLKGLLQPEEIKSIREHYGLSARQFAKLLCLGDHTIYELESGTIATPSLDTAIRSVATLSQLKRYLTIKKTKLPQKDVERLLHLCNTQADIYNEKYQSYPVKITYNSPCYA